MSYTSVFGGTTIYPSDVSYLAIALDADTPLEWPLESSGTEAPAARIIDVTPDVSDWSILLPDATLTGAGQTILFNNLSGAAHFYIKDFAGNTLATVEYGEQWQVYLAATTTAAGTWRVFRYGASTATVQPSALAGYGLTVTDSTLSQSLPVTTFTSTPRTVLITDRASALVWEGTGLGTLNLPSAVAAGNNFFISVRNAGGGDLTIDPDGGQLIDGGVTLALRPGDSATLVTDGTAWFSIGLGQEAIFAFDYTSIDLTGLSGTYTLAGSELNRVAYTFIGTLAGNIQIIVPATIQQYWVDNATAAVDAYTLTLNVSGGAFPVSVNRGSRGIYYCTGTAVVNASTAGVSVPISATDGGTGQTGYTTGDLLYASATTALSRLADVAVGNALISGGVGVVPAWGKIGLTTHVSGTLPIANGGTGATTAANARTALGLGTLAVQDASAVSISGGSITGITDLAIADGGTGAGTAADARINLLPSYTGNANKVLTLNAGATDVEWASVATGTVTSVAALTLGTTGTDLSSTVANGTTTPVITLNVPTASATNRGALSSADWTTFNGKAASGANTDITALDQDVTITATGTIAANTIGYRGLPQNSQTSVYTLTLADAGKHISITTGGIVIPANGSVAFPIGTTIVIFNNSGTAQNISITTDTLRWAGTASTGTRSLAQYGLATLVKVANTPTPTWVINGTLT